ncbi:hypothetical protein EXIGLDRAFT_833278 [Exidia glandulosa HHB12029]|uniref:Uncharacterized protein n=1 Tax=Exidia glandulosa HHB12029 TaxID=1314781 RepID=A0A165KTG9_EXIGL|nr:hypothetical protein EXIGLDRAFT_833278 [Exidia glandulosa HHB12029]
MSRRSRKRKDAQRAEAAVTASDTSPSVTLPTTTSSSPLFSFAGQPSGCLDRPARPRNKPRLSFQKGEIVWARVSVDAVVGRIAEAVEDVFLKADATAGCLSDDDLDANAPGAVASDNAPVTGPNYALRPCIVSHQSGKKLFVIVLASFRGNPIESVSGLARFFCVAMGEAARDEDALAGRPFLESTPPWAHPDGRNCYAIAFLVETKTYYVSRQRNFRLVEGFETFSAWMNERLDDLDALPNDGGRALLASYLQDKDPLDTPPEYPPAVAWNDVAASATSWVLSSPLSWTGSAMSSSSYAPSLLSVLGLNPNAAEFRPSSMAGASVMGAIDQGLSYRSRNVLQDLPGVLRTNAACKSSAEDGKENVPLN